MERESEQPVTHPDDVATIAAAIREAGAVAIDLEFVPEGRYIPELALVQVAWGDPDSPAVAAIDPIEVDPTPVLRLVGDAEIETILHAGQADLALLAGAYGIEGRRIRDTQIAAGFLGLGDQIGYGPLLDRVLGVRIHKGSQYTEWLRRPLSETQIAYALDDVRYLQSLWRHMERDLEQRGRLGWVDEECDRLARTADRRPAPEDAYRRVKSWTRLRRSALGALRGAAGWREQEAQRRNVPPARVLADRPLLEFARSGASSRQDLLAIRGVNESTLRRDGDAILHSLREGTEAPPPAPPPARPSAPQIDVWTAVIQGLVRSNAAAAEIAPRFVATRDDVEALAHWWLSGDHEQPPRLALLDGWRRDLAGEQALRWLAGETALIADAAETSGIVFEPR